MTIHSADGRFAWDVTVPPAPAPQAIRTLIVDHDPVSRRVLRSVLHSRERIDVVACVDSHEPVAEWPLRHIDVAVLVVDHHESLLGVVRELTTRPIHVLLIRIDWTRRDLDAAVSAGVSGCLVKDGDLRRLVGGVLAVTGGNVIFSPELLRLYSATPVPGTSQHCHAMDTVRRLSDRELEILELLGAGMSTDDAAKKCGVSNATVKSHVSHALSKLGARNRLEAVLMINGAIVPRNPPLRGAAS